MLHFVGCLKVPFFCEVVMWSFDKRLCGSLTKKNCDCPLENVNINNPKKCCLEINDSARIIWQLVDSVYFTSHQYYVKIVWTLCHSVIQSNPDRRQECNF